MATSSIQSDSVQAMDAGAEWLRVLGQLAVAVVDIRSIGASVDLFSKAPADAEKIQMALSGLGDQIAATVDRFDEAVLDLKEIVFASGNVTRFPDR